MRKLARLICLGLLVAAAGYGHAGQVFAAERLEVSGIKAVRPTIVKTIAALKKGDVAGAKAAFEEYDSGWNGIEVYINTRDKNMYAELEQNLQAKISKGLNSPTPDAPALLADAQTLLAKYDEAIAMVEKAEPLNPLYDDVAHLRMVRASLREVTPALKDGDIAKARKSYSAFDHKYASVEGLIKTRSQDSDNDIVKGMAQIKSALMAEKPDVDQSTASVKVVMDKYNAVVADVTKDARAQK
jgi:high-affinity iron transporter